MFITDSFNSQLDDLLLRLCEKLQISETDHKKAEDRYNAVGKWLAQSDSGLASYSPAIYPQGSLKIGTTVKPLAYQEFDLDLVCELDIDHERYDPVAVLNGVEKRLREHHIYKRMIERKNRCIRLNYANEFHMDILPAAPHGIENGGKVKVPDRKAEEWKDSNPKGYAAWFEGRTVTFRLFAAKAENVDPLPDMEETERKPPLKKSVQLIKRCRDISFKETGKTPPISIVLTTLAAAHYKGDISINQSLMHILNGIVSCIPENGRLIVRNPTNTTEDFSEKWDADRVAYYEFVRWISKFSTAWAKINTIQGIPQIMKMLQELFGESVLNDALREQTEFVNKVRQDRLLGTMAYTGSLTSAANPRSIPVKKNTFYGV